MVGRSALAVSQAAATPAADSPAEVKQAVVSSSAVSPAAVSPAVISDAVRWPRVVPAGAGDHGAIHQLLMSVFHAPSRDAFYASLDDPFYEPHNRLLIKRGAQLISHLQITKRVMQFGRLKFPVDGIGWLGTLHEFRCRGLAGQLLRTAEKTMQRDGAVLGLLSTRIPRFFRPSGWAVCGRHSHARAGSRELLAQLSARGFAPGEGSLSIRPWRQVELPALMRLYHQNTAQAIGPVERNEAYWRWLISRRGFDRIFVAVEGPDKLDLETSVSQIVGYMITKEDRILELMAAPGNPAVAAELLARACSESIERDCHTVTLHAPPHDPQYELFRVAGGTQHHHEEHQGEVFMVKLLDPAGFLRAICPQLHERAERARLTRPCELGLWVEGQKYRLVATRRSVKVGRSRLGRSYLRLNQAELTRLVLGHVDLDESIAHNRMRASTRLALETARALFPRLPLWHPPVDDLSC
jgi:predicted acetyltransferase